MCIKQLHIYIYKFIVFQFIGLCMELLRIIVTVTRPFSDKVLDFFYCLVMGPHKPLPPIENKILLMSATELARNIRKRKVKLKTHITFEIDKENNAMNNNYYY